MAALFSSCTKDEIGGSQLDGVREVVVSAVVDWSMKDEPQMAKAQTRGTATCSRYVMEIYSDAGYTTLAGTQQTSTDGTFAPVSLDRTKNYYVLVWADGGDYTISNGLTAITKSATSSEAFAGKATIEGKTNTLSVSLKRAVASVTLLETNTLSAGQVTVAFTEPTTYNVATGAVSGANTRTETVTIAADVDGTTTPVKLNDSPIYLLATATAQNIDFSLQYKDATLSAAEKTFTVTASVVANRNTNIKGHYTTFVPAVVGDFYMKDGTWVSKDATLTDAQKADCIGIVCFVYAGGKSGRIVGLTEGYLKWSSENVVTYTTENFDGRKNMATIASYLARKGKSWDLYPAFKWAAQQNGKTEGGWDATDRWYLPGVAELSELNRLKKNVNISLNSINASPFSDKFGTYYWSSTEGKTEADIYARIVMSYMTEDDMFHTHKKYPLSIRVFSTF